MLCPLRNDGMDGYILTQIEDGFQQHQSQRPFLLPLGHWGPLGQQLPWCQPGFLKNK